MTTTETRTAQILKAAKKAVSTIADPALRAKAAARLEATQKKMVAASQQAQSEAIQTHKIRERDLDFDR